MKKFLFFLCLSAGSISEIMAQHTVDCDFESVVGSITTNRTLYANTLYRLEGCVDVSTGVTLTIEPGTRILAEKASNAALYIKPGAILDAQGTSTLPIRFESDQEPLFRDYGDWQGIIIGGEAINNVPTTGLVTLSRNCSISAGGVDDADYSGIIQYVQIHHAKYALEMVSVGSATVVDHIDVSQSSKNAFSVYGGAVNMKYLVSQNAKQNDFYIAYGYQGKMQFAVANHEDAAAHDAAGTYGLFIENNPSTTSATRYTIPSISNFTLLGPAFCNAGSLHADFKDAVHLGDYVRGGIYNTVVDGYKLDALSITGANTVANTFNDVLSFAYNAVSNVGNDANNPTWTGGCGPDMDSWINGSASVCGEAGNQLKGFGATGYDNSIICSSTTPDFRLDNATTALDPSDFSAAALSDAFFDDGFAYRGAFDESDNWVAEWTDFDAQNTIYCTSHRVTGKSPANEVMKMAKLSVAPNPARNMTYTSFDLAKTGQVRIVVLDKVSGKSLRTINATISEKGKQRIAVDVSGLLPGSYILSAETPSGEVLHNQLMVTD